jgi:hypothetical protein
LKCPPQAYKIIVGNGLDRSVALKSYPIMGNNFRVSERSRPFPTFLF